MQIQFPLILDGATGTELQKRGFTGDVSAEEWVLAHPEAIADIQRGYVQAGSQVLYCPSFGANRQKLEEHGIFNKTADYNRRLAELSQKAAESRVLIAGDLSPTGLFLAPMGQASFEELVDIYADQAAGLEQAGVDLYVIETMMTLSDARAAVLAVLQGMGIDAFGLNCSAGPREMLPQLKRLREYARVPLIAKPNAGMPQIVDGKAVYHCPPEEFTALVPEFLQAGVAIFGGCCGTDAGHIAALKKALDGAQITPPAPQHTALLPAATEKLPMYLPVDARHGAVIAVTESLEDDLLEAMDGDEPMVAVALTSPADAEALADVQYMIQKPLCLVCDDGDVLEAALRVYQGRALYEGPVPEERLETLRKKYGVIY